MQSPAQEILKDPARHDELKPYVQDVVGRFRADRRVQVWDLYNEPDNPVPQYKDVELKNKAEVALQLLQEDVRLGARNEPDAAAHVRRVDRQLARPGEADAHGALPA